MSRRSTMLGLLMCMSFWTSAAEDSDSQTASSDVQRTNKAIQVDPTYLPMVAAIISGFALLVTLGSALFGMALVYRHLGTKATLVASRQPRMTLREMFADGENRSTQDLMVQRGGSKQLGSSSSSDSFPRSPPSSLVRFLSSDSFQPDSTAVSTTSIYTRDTSTDYEIHELNGRVKCRPTMPVHRQVLRRHRSETTV